MLQAVITLQKKLKCVSLLCSWSMVHVFLDQLPIFWCHNGWYRLHGWEVMSINRFWEDKSPEIPTVHRRQFAKVRTCKKALICNFLARWKANDRKPMSLRIKTFLWTIVQELISKHAYRHPHARSQEDIYDCFRVRFSTHAVPSRVPEQYRKERYTYANFWKY